MIKTNNILDFSYEDLFAKSEEIVTKFDYMHKRYKFPYSIALIKFSKIAIEQVEIKNLLRKMDEIIWIDKSTSLVFFMNTDYIHANQAIFALERNICEKINNQCYTSDKKIMLATVLEKTEKQETIELVRILLQNFNISFFGENFDK